MNKLLKSRTVRLVLLVAAAALGGAAISYAAIPGAAGVISGCYEKRTGILRVIDADQGKTCTSWETPLTWNQAGPAGPPGPQGLQGPQGEKGDSAPSTLVTRFEYAMLNSNSSSGLGVECQPGERVTGGGGWTSGNGVYMTASYPSEPLSWRVQYENTSASPAPINAWVVCASS